MALVDGLSAEERLRLVKMLAETEDLCDRIIQTTSRELLPGLPANVVSVALARMAALFLVEARAICVDRGGGLNFVNETFEDWLQRVQKSGFRLGRLGDDN